MESTKYLSLAEYHAEREHDSNSSLTLFYRSPALYYETRITGRIKPKQTDQMRLGAALHTAILEPERFDEFFRPIPNHVLAKNRSRVGKAWIDWALDCSEKFGPDVILLKTKEHEQLKWQVDKILHHPIASQLLRHTTDCELTYFFEWEGHPLKVRFDGLDSIGGSFFDLKRTRSTIQDFWREVRRFGYHRQAALYSVAYELLYDVKPIERWIICHDEPPYDVYVRIVPQSLIDLGLLELRQILSQLTECRAGLRPWAPTESLVEEELELPSWFCPNGFADVLEHYEYEGEHNSGTNP